MLKLITFFDNLTKIKLPNFLNHFLENNENVFKSLLLVLLLLFLDSIKFVLIISFNDSIDKYPGLFFY